MNAKIKATRAARSMINAMHTSKVAVMTRRRNTDRIVSGRRLRKKTPITQKVAVKSHF